MHDGKIQSLPSHQLFSLRHRSLQEVPVKDLPAIYSSKSARRVLISGEGRVKTGKHVIATSGRPKSRVLVLGPQLNHRTMSPTHFKNMQPLTLSGPRSFPFYSNITPIVEPHTPNRTPNITRMVAFSCGRRSPRFAFRSCAPLAAYSHFKRSSILDSILEFTMYIVLGIYIYSIWVQNGDMGIMERKMETTI